MMRSILYRQSGSCGLGYGSAPKMILDEGKEAPSGGEYVEQIEPMRIENVEPDYFNMDERDREEIRRMESPAARNMAQLISKETDRMELEGNILMDESLEEAHIERAVERIVQQMQGSRQPEGYLEDLVRILLLNEIYDRRRRCRRRGNCGRR